MSDVVKTLLDRRANLVEQMRELAERAVNDGRDMSAEEDRQFTEMNAEVDALQTRADAMLDGQRKAKETEDAFAAIHGKPQERQGKTPEESETADQIRAFMKSRNSDPLIVPVGGVSERRQREMTERRDLTVTGAGGLVPAGFRAQLWEYLIETSGIMNAGVDLLETDSGESIKLPRITAHQTATATAEAANLTEGQPTASSVDSIVSKEGYLVQLSTELVSDSGVDLEGYLARAAGRALGEAVGAAAVTAAVAAAGVGVTTAAGELTNLGSQGTAGKGFDYIISLFHSVIDPYRRRPSCSWLMSDAAAAMVRKVKSTEGVYVWQPSVIPSQPDTILSKPVHVDTNVADPAANAESILFGDFSSLVVRIAGGFRFERSDDFAFNADLVTFRAVVRHGTVSVDANALKSLAHPAA
ncbi:MAG: phage major capsid protein [Vicinamibacteria bacterium]